MSLYSKFLMQTYNIGIIRKTGKDIIKDGVKQGDIVWLRHNYKDRFFADPFMIKQDEDYFYILVEEYLFWEEKGKITLLTIKKNDFSLVQRKIVIEEETHLSFPFCELNGTTVIPEAVISGKTCEYTFDYESMSVTGKREIIPEGLVDAVYYTDKHHNRWVLTAKKNNPKEDMYLYQFNGTEYVPMNGGKVVLKSIETTRSAGRFFEIDGCVYRPVQDSTGGYGKQTRIMKIHQLGEEAYQAECVRIINSKDNPPFNETLHTFNVYDDCIIVDGSKDFFRFPMKILYKKFKFLFHEK